MTNDNHDHDDDELPEGASRLICMARAAHRQGDRRFEKAVRTKLTLLYGIDVRFPCCDAVDRDVKRGQETLREPA